MSKRRHSVFFSCEHASNAVPEFLSPYFKNARAKEFLDSHRGYDIGAAEVFRELIRILHPAFAIEGAYTRLAIDFNRNSDRNHRYSEFSEKATPEEKERLERLHADYRGSFLGAIRKEMSEKRSVQILHLSIHSFTPELDGKIRNADIGILYDPARKEEAALARVWKESLKKIATNIRVRFNYPYLGKTDGHTTALRKIFPQTEYLGFEIEMNQALFRKSRPEDIARMLAKIMA